ncbi:F-box/FBD/LRR-repeat protein At1g13570-like [Diospyros lotus]|uniref:F-box/FBD/LRR-repeat protein At1g13570-like n=1 Tax=Diospyros lotus TaxID=55363 RepID=UPI002258AEFF|nr:F-box/FBD/LRR-repeat protein At1g13570-like [Diospyros lotus]XP_052209111.1 F-box/FBD/LRR-repeat protein At1g13570-like [Diospyros lotus]XP_052209112.1 F-box/FBD/LRR-repeat protein At1g13570-like [Diospyros lotus]XP_052209113.1 F-box/FBD/LRR-repeat protein At1g13570-like [Diospyros lotus]
MQNGCVKKMQGSTSDRISYLPSNVIEKILTCMPIDDSVRTSVLSKKWRYTWVTLPELVFDDAFYRKLRITSTNELLLIIYQVLLLHRGPILKFKLHLSEWNRICAIDRLINFVSNNGVQDFILHIFRYVHYELPSSVFSCLQLEHLELHLCSFVPPPGFKGFSKLLSLELHDVIINSGVLSGLISNCPLLKELNLVRPGSFCDPDSFGYLEITAPNLRCLYCEGDFSDICLKNSPNLARVSLDLHHSMYQEVWVTLAGLPAIEFLELKFFRLKLIPQIGVPGRLPTDLSHLKVLKLDGIKPVSSFLRLIRSSPNLEKLIIWVNNDMVLSHVGPILEDFEEQGFLDISLNRLREVDLRICCKRGFQLEFVKFLLTTSPALEKMVIEPIHAMDHERMMFWKAVTQFRRLSPLAEVFFEFQDDDDDDDDDLDYDYDMHFLPN